MLSELHTAWHVALSDDAKPVKIATALALVVVVVLWARWRNKP